MPPVNLVDPATGKAFEFDAETAETLLKLDQGWTVETPRDEAARTMGEVEREEYGDVTGQIGAGFAGALRGASFGASDVAARLLAPELADKLGRLKEANPITSAVTEIGGAVVPTIASGGTGAVGTVARLTPAGALGRALAPVARAGAEAGAVARVGRGVAAGAIEGGVQELGAGASDLALAKDDPTMERIVSSLSSRFLFGGIVGGATGGFMGALESVAHASARRVAQARAEADKLGEVPADLLDKDKRQLRALKDEEYARVEAERAPQRAELAAEIDAFREMSKGDQPWVAVASGGKASKKAAKKAAKAARLAGDEVAEVPPAAAVDDARTQVDMVSPVDLEAPTLPGGAATMVDPATIVERGGPRTKVDRGLAARVAEADAGPRTVADPGMAKRMAAEAKLHAELAGAAPAPRWVREAEKIYVEADKYLDRVLRDPKGLVGDPGLARKALRQQEHALEVIMGRQDELRALYATDRTGRRAAALDAVPKYLERNRALQQRIADLTAPPATPRLAQLQAAEDLLASPQKKGLMEQVAGGAAFGVVMGAVAGLPVPGAQYAAPFIAAKASEKVGELLAGKLGSVARASSERSARAIDAFLGVSERARPAAVPLASRVLNAVRFTPAADPGRREAAPVARASLGSQLAAGKGGDLFRAFAERSRELADMVQPELMEPGFVRQGPPKLKIRPGARRAIGERLSGIAVRAPHVADRIETEAVRRLEFLAARMPRTKRLGMTEIPPDEFAIRAWARFIAAADDPGAIEERLADGTITPEDAEVMRELYPERMRNILQEVARRMGEVNGTLPYRRQLSLAILTGAPVSAATEPHVLDVLQGAHASEESSSGGTEAPRPEAAFASVQKSIPSPTPAQARAG